MPQLTPHQAFTRFVPETAVIYCAQLWQENKFDLKITRKRATKLGDYRYDFQKKKHTISVNHELNKYGFLVTYLHEVAHLKTFVKYGNRVLPHGKEWKKEFQLLASPVLNKETFPEIILRALIHYMNNPKASSCSDFQLSEAIRSFDEKKGEVSLATIPTGEKFIFNKRLFVKEDLRRTRYICKEEKTGRKFLIPKVALVQKIDGV